MSLCPSRPLVLLLGVSIIGCAVGPDYRKQEPNAPARWSRIDPSARRLTHAGTTGDLQQWWRRLGDPRLSKLVDEALLASPDLRKAKARLREARARRAVAAAARYPSLSASGSASRSDSTSSATTGTATGNSFSAGFDASWELDLFGGVRRGVEAAQADLDSSEASLQDARVSLVAEVARNYFEVRSLQVRLEIARGNFSSQTETLKLTEFRARAGLASIQDVEQARSLREQTAAQIPSLETSQAEAEHRLDVLLGKAPGTLQATLAGGSGLPAAPSEIAVGIPADTLRQRPDVRVAERKLAAETARVGVAKAARFPTLKLSGSIGLEALLGGALGNTISFVYSLLAGISAPLFDGGRLRHQVEIQDAVREQAEVAYQQAVLTALQEVENSLVALAKTRERGEALMRATEAARNAALLARQRYSAGVIDFQSVLDTQRSVLTIEDSLATTRADGVQALIRLYKALGGGWSPSPRGKDAP